MIWPEDTVGHEVFARDFVAWWEEVDMIKATTKNVSGRDHELLEPYFLKSTGECIVWWLQDVNVEVTKNNLNSSDVKVTHHLQCKVIDACVLRKSVDVDDVITLIGGLDNGAVRRLEVVCTDWDDFGEKCNAFTFSMVIVMFENVSLIMQVSFQPCFLDTYDVTLIY